MIKISKWFFILLTVQCSCDYRNSCDYMNPIHKVLVHTLALKNVIFGHAISYYITQILIVILVSSYKVEEQGSKSL